MEANGPPDVCCLTDEGSVGRVSVGPLPQTDSTRGQKKTPSELLLVMDNRQEPTWGVELPALWLPRTSTWGLTSEVKPDTVGFRVHARTESKESVTFPRTF